MSGCRHVLALLEPFRDGELSPSQAVEVETHLLECKVCAERVKLGHALRTSLKEAVHAEAEVSASFEERIRLALEAERGREERSDSMREPHGRMLGWRGILPMAAAAAVVLGWAASANNRTPGHGTTEAAMSSTPASIEQLVEELVNHYQQGQGPMFTDSKALPQLEPEVGVPVKLPDFNTFGAHWEGVSVVPVSNQRAASLRYRIAGHRLTVYVYDASRLPVRRMLQERKVRDESVYVGQRHGVSIAARERHNGIGYAVASDLNSDESAELVAAIY
jgi:anti-sigma factor RsiW